MCIRDSYNIAEHYFQEFKEFIPTDIDFASLNSALSERRHSSFSYLKDVISNNLLDETVSFGFETIKLKAGESGTYEGHIDVMSLR